MKEKRTVLITGGTRGIGRALVENFWDRGCNLAVIARDTEMLDALKQKLKKKRGQKLLTLCVELSEIGFEEYVSSKLNENFEDIDILVNNAATQGQIGPILSSDLTQWESVLKVNLLAPVLMSQIAIRKMGKKGGSIINISGGGAAGPRKNFAAYACSKAALVRFTDTLAAELPNMNVNVNALAPGAMPTRMMTEILNSGVEKTGIAEQTKAREVLTNKIEVKNLADIIFALNAPENRQLTGKFLSIQWDNLDFSERQIAEMMSSDIFSLGRIVGKARNLEWLDK